MLSTENSLFLRENDVLLASFPRSGNTWIMNLLMYLGILVLEQYVHGLHIDRPVDMPDEPSEYIPALKKLKSVVGNERARYRVVKSHEQYQHNFRKSIYVIRDGRDVMVSYYYYSKRFNHFESSFLDFLNRSPSPAREWAAHVQSWISHPKSAIFLTRYENLLRDPFKEVQGILSFLGETRSFSDISTAISHCSFEKLAGHESAAKPNPTPDPNLNFFRRGTAGDWKVFFSSEHILKFKEEANWMLLKLGYVSSDDW